MPISLATTHTGINWPSQEAYPVSSLIYPELAPSNELPRRWGSGGSRSQEPRRLRRLHYTLLSAAVKRPVTLSTTSFCTRTPGHESIHAGRRVRRAEYLDKVVAPVT